MKKFLLFAYSAILVGALASCGGSSDSDNESNESEEVAEAQNYELMPATTSITGPLGQAYEVVNRDYKLKKTYSSYEILVEVELTDPAGLPAGFDPSKVGTRFNEGEGRYPMIANFTIEYLDQYDDVIDYSQATSSYSDLLRLSKGETSTLRFYVPNNELNEIEYFRIKSDYYPNEIEGNVKAASGNSDAETYSDDDFDKTLEQAGKVAETAGKMLETTGEIMKSLNDLTK